MKMMEDIVLLPTPQWKNEHSHVAVEDLELHGRCWEEHKLQLVAFLLLLMLQHVDNMEEMEHDGCVDIPEEEQQQPQVY